MTNKETIFAVFENQETDRVPVGFWFHFLPLDKRDSGVSEPALLNDNVAGHKKYIDTFHPDFVKIMSDGFFHYPAGEGETYETAGDLEKITVITKAHPWITGQVELVRRVTALQADTPYFYNIISPISSLEWLIGADVLYRQIKQSPRQIKAAMERITDGQLALAKAVIEEGGADGIYFSVSNPDHEKIADAVYQQVIAPGEVRFLEEINRISRYHILHICGYEGKRNHLNLYRYYPAKVINWAVNVEGVSLLDGKQLFGGRAVIGGFANVGGSLIHTGSKAEIQSFTRKLIAEAGKTGVILGADCTISDDINLEHLEWVRQAAAE